jgi:hypothetical protein
MIVIFLHLPMDDHQVGCKHWFKPMLASCGILDQSKGYEKGVFIF